MSDLSLSGYHSPLLIGSGHSGSVFRAHREDGHEVAIKKLDSMAIDRDRLHRNCRRFQQAPPHEGVVPLLDFQVDATPYHLVSEWMEGGRLLDAVVVPMTEEKAWPMILELARSLAHLHKHGVHHGNLHPGNVFLNADGLNPKTTDFGLGLVGKVHHIDIGETAWFAPPEQLENAEAWEDGAVERWDVYRFGVIAFWLITGEVPRGRGYRTVRDKAIAESGGRPVPVDILTLADDMRQISIPEWKIASEGENDPEGRLPLKRQVIDRCLSLDPAARPVDMREVVDAFDELERRFVLEDAEIRIQKTIDDAEARVIAEQKRQARRDFRIRALAACLFVSLSATALFLVRYHRRSHTFENRAADLAFVIEHQKSKLEASDHRWSQSQHELRTTREAADSVFSQIGQPGQGQGEEGIPAEGSMDHENLENSRQFFTEAVKEAAADPSRKVEQARGLHHLAHVESRLGEKELAEENLAAAIALFEEIIEERSGEVTVLDDCHSRLADCHEAMAKLIERDPSEKMLFALREASRYLRLVSQRRPDDHQITMRRLAVDFRLARQMHDHREFGAAISGYADLGNRLESMLQQEPDSGPLLERLEEVQFHTAETLRDQGRDHEASDAYLAALETLTQIVGDRAYSEEQMLRLGQIYAEFGDLMVGRIPQDEAKEIFNEAFRLLTPIADRQPEHVEAVTLIARAMAQIGKIERESGRWTDGYRISLAAIEKLEASLETSPDHLDGKLVLVGLRVGHTELLRHQKSSAVTCLKKGVEMAVEVLQKVDTDTELPRGVRQTARIRLAGLFENYGKLCESLGDAERAELCFERASRARELLVLRDPAKNSLRNQEASAVSKSL